MRSTLALLALLPLASCASHHGNLDGNWSLTHINNQPVNLLSTQAAPTLTFAHGTLSDDVAGRPNVATYTSDDSGRAQNISFPDLTNYNLPTMPDDLEAQYKIALARADTARVIDGNLYLWDGGEEVLRFGHMNSERTANR